MRWLARLINLEFEFSGVAEESEGDVPEFPAEFVWALNRERTEIGIRAGKQIADLLCRKNPVVRAAFPVKLLVYVDIHFRTGSLLWGGWVSIQSALVRSYNDDAVLVDLGSIGGNTFVPDLIRRLVANGIDAVVAEKIEQRQSNAHRDKPALLRASTSVVPSNTMIEREVRRLSAHLKRRDCAHIAILSVIGIVLLGLIAAVATAYPLRPL